MAPRSCSTIATRKTARRSRGEIAEKRGATLVPPYDDPFVIAGQGTAGREIAEDMAALGLTPDIVVAPASGGGLIAGVATAVKARFPQTQMIVAEPEGFDDHARSLRAGKREPHRARKAAPSATR